MSKDTRYRLKLIELDGVTCVSVKKSGKHYCAWKGEEPKGKFTHIYKDPKKKKFEFTKKLTFIISLFMSLTNFILVSLSISGFSKILSIIIVIEVKGVFN